MKENSEIIENPMGKENIEDDDSEWGDEDIDECEYISSTTAFIDLLEVINSLLEKIISDNKEKMTKEEYDTFANIMHDIDTWIGWFEAKYYIIAKVE